MEHARENDPRKTTELKAPKVWSNRAGHSPGAGVVNTLTFIAIEGPCLQGEAMVTEWNAFLVVFSWDYRAQ